MIYARSIKSLECASHFIPLDWNEYDISDGRLDHSVFVGMLPFETLLNNYHMLNAGGHSKNARNRAIERSKEKKMCITIWKFHLQTHKSEQS